MRERPWPYTTIPELRTDYGSYWELLETFRFGIIPDVFEMKFLSEVQLAKEVEGLVLRDWIAADQSRGTLNPITKEITLWSVDRVELPAIQERMFESGLILSRANLDHQALVKNLYEECRKRFTVEEAKKQKPNRKKLLALLRTLEERYGEDGAESPVVTIEEFFPGNTVDQSNAANLSPHPGLKGFCDVLKRIHGRDTVQDVLIAISDSPMLPKTDDGEFEDDDWPYSEEVYVLTSSSPAEVEKWAAKLQPDTVSLTHWRNNQPPKGAPELQAGMQLIRLWWD